LPISCHFSPPFHSAHASLPFLPILFNPFAKLPFLVFFWSGGTALFPSPHLLFFCWSHPPPRSGDPRFLCTFRGVVAWFLTSSCPFPTRFSVFRNCFPILFPSDLRNPRTRRGGLSKTCPIRRSSLSAFFVRLTPLVRVPPSFIVKQGNFCGGFFFL